jgi:hypothetical protein
MRQMSSASSDSRSFNLDFRRRILYVDLRQFQKLHLIVPNAVVPVIGALETICEEAVRITLDYGQEARISIPTSSRPVLWPTQPPMQCETGAFVKGVKETGA